MRYEDEYAAHNPQWHIEDAPDKASDVLTSFRRTGLAPNSICDVGCGAGEVLALLHDELRIDRCVGYDVSEYAIDLARRRHAPGLAYVCGDASADPEPFDVLLLLDVLEHVGDPVAFLEGVRHKAPVAVVNLPLELSVLKVLSPQSLARGREDLGHVHYFNAAVARAMVGEAGWHVRDSWFSPPGRGADVARATRRALRAAQRAAARLRPELAARTIGGCSLMMVIGRAA